MDAGVNANFPAYPGADARYGSAWHGLTKREAFAKAAMVGLLAADAQEAFGYEGAAQCAVNHADALLAELAKEKPDGPDG